MSTVYLTYDEKPQPRPSYVVPQNEILLRNNNYQRGDNNRYVRQDERRYSSPKLAPPVQQPVVAGNRIAGNKQTAHSLYKKPSLSLSSRSKISTNDVYLTNEELDYVEQIEERKRRLKNGDTKHRTIAGFWKQFAIISWKNIILTRRNACGMITEIVCPLVLILMILLIRYFVNAYVNYDQTNTPTNVIDLFPISNSTKNVMYYPNNTFVKNMVTSAVNIIKSRKSSFNPTIIASPVSNGTQLDTTSTSNLLALISFPDSYNSTLPNEAQYTVYTLETQSYQYNVANTLVSKINYMFTNSPGYYCFQTDFFQLYNTFNGYKLAVDMAMITSMTGVTLNDATMVKMQQFNCPSYTQDDLKATFTFFTTILIAIAFLFTLIVTVSSIVVEKQTKMKEYLKLVGVKWQVMWLSWFLRSIIIYTVISVLFCAVGEIPMPVKPENSTRPLVVRQLFTTTNFEIAFLTLFVYSLQVSVFTIMISQMFSKPFIAKTVVIFLWIGSAINFYDSLPNSAIKYIFCIFPNTGLIFALQCIFQFERGAKTLGYAQLYDNMFGDTLNLGSVLTSMFGYTLLYIPIAWYVERIFPGEYGVPLPLHFPFTPAYWNCKPNKIRHRPVKKPKIPEEKKHAFEQEPEKLKESVRIEDIKKEFRTGFETKTVVNNLTLNFYENQITGLLGHNGAGKSTSIFMLCGMYPPTSGTAKILGFDIATEMDKIRTSLGFCPQHDILYDDLTVEEHLKMIAMIKGYPNKALEEEIQSKSKYVGLHNDLQTTSKKLSGGMKRRLSVAMALIGDSKVIILDEPTSGLDPFNRRGLWELIRKYKEGRTIILTTHFMEEADALSDRIAIMNHGEVKCCGSPLFLKNLYGSGYRMTASKSPYFDEPKLLKLVRETVGEYKIEANTSSEISIGLSQNTSHNLPTMLRLIEQQKESLGLSSYGITSSTLEEVFLKVGRIDQEVDQYDEEEIELNKEILEDAFRTDVKKHEGSKLWFQQIRALLIKRFYIFFRRYILASVTLFLPLVLETILCAVLPSGTNLENSVSGRVSSSGTYDLKIQNYRPYTMPYTITGNVSTTNLVKLFQLFYTTANRPDITLDSLSNDTISPYVFQKRKDDVRNLVSNYYTGMSFNQVSATKIYVNAYYSTFAYHSSASIINEVSNLLLAFYSSNNLTKKITTFNNPINAIGVRSGDAFLDMLTCIDILPLSLISFVNAILIGFCIGLIVVHVGRERVNGSKSLQLLSGVHFVTYWIANHIFDCLVCLFQIISIVCMIKIVDAIRNDSAVEIHPFGDESAMGYLFMLLLFSIPAWTSLAYIWSNFFKSEIVGFVVLIIVLGIAAFFDMIWSFLGLYLKSTNGSADATRFISALQWIMIVLFPNVMIKRAMFDIKIKQNSFCISTLNTILGTSYKSDEAYASLSEPGIGVFIFFITLIQLLIFNSILFVVEKKPKVKNFCRNSEDELAHFKTPKLEADVATEHMRIEKSDLDLLAYHEPLVLKDIVLNYKKNKRAFAAVNHLSFGVLPTECFGLLGINGAGKTSTFKILTGEVEASSGKAFINGFDINKERYNARRSLGFCPQFDCLPEYLTVEQSLKLFAALRGLEFDWIPNIVDDMITVFRLNEFNSKLVQDLSGGNKRKVSTVIAFLGKPQVVILDEPTTGVDPAAKRYLWTVINKARDLGMTIVLTSHSMEECEALCTRLGIMVNGQIQCLGNVQHLKSKYGKGYSLTIKLKTFYNFEELARGLHAFLVKNIPGIEKKEQQQETVFYHVNLEHGKQNLADFFSIIERNKVFLYIESYSVSQTTLEDVFLSFAKLQENIEEPTKNDYKNALFQRKFRVPVKY